MSKPLSLTLLEKAEVKRRIYSRFREALSQANEEAPKTMHIPNNVYLRTAPPSPSPELDRDESRSSLGTFNETPPSVSAQLPPPDRTSPAGELYTDEPYHDGSSSAVEGEQRPQASRLVYDSARLDKTPLPGTSQTDLIFESRFECGNLRRAWRRVKEPEDCGGVYDLYLRPDDCSASHTQWFYFRIGNLRPYVPYHVNIVNFQKPTSLFQQGMRILMYSEGRGWYRGGKDISYCRNSLRTGRYQASRPYHSLSFTLQTDGDTTTLYLAYSYPYSYTALQQYLRDLMEEPARRKFCRRDVLCRSLAGNIVDIVTVTDFTKSEDMSTRKGVVITARVHPGESNSSWTLEGFLTFLTGCSPQAKRLRELFVFKVIPMLNPDGVINGSYRCGGSLDGSDLNRIWHSPSKKCHPTVFAAKQVIRRLSDERGLFVFVDLHGHSRRHNMFIYGCPPTPAAVEQVSTAVAHVSEQVFPRMLWRQAENFSFQDCKFTIQKSKENTARAVVNREFNCLNSFTLETSFSGADQGSRAGFHFNQRHYQEMGEQFCHCLLAYAEGSPSNSLQIAEQELLAYYPVTEEPQKPIVEGGRACREGRQPKKVRSKSRSTSSKRRPKLASHSPPTAPSTKGDNDPFGLLGENETGTGHNAAEYQRVAVSRVEHRTSTSVEVRGRSSRTTSKKSSQSLSRTFSALAVRSSESREAAKINQRKQSR
ncbi:unnamed protein product (mitochondrion) [Plasmodiophora brassicae]|uniref:Peptidase M14 domain-containing protein n=1 Tax=Plasmodiophora brassicae TaxID=37360 RepID=A0A3P3YAU7_PLABS|nr:unnamed protein product [Plasmodiophora brassicae]